jgi:hypothetical protein
MDPDDWTGFIYQIKATPMLNFNIGTDMYGVDTPSPIEPTLPSEAQSGGILGWLGNQLGNIFAGIQNYFNWGLNVEWIMFTYMLDTIASWAGYPGLFSNLFAFLGNLWTGVVTGFSAFASMLASFLTFSGSFLTDLVSNLATGAGIWTNMVTMMMDMIGGAYGTGVDLWTTLNVSQWVIVGLILYPMYLLFLWDQKGFDALADHLLFVKDVLAFIGGVFLRIIEIFTNIISRIIEAIPVAE